MERHANGCPSLDACDLASRLLRDAGYVYQYREPGTHYSTGLLCARRWTSPPRVQRLRRNGEAVCARGCQESGSRIRQRVVRARDSS